MKLIKFIQELKKLLKQHGDDIEVIMADNKPVINPIFSEDYPNKKSIVITDEKQTKL